ncbi:MAG: hypothetical protein AB1485_06095 [Candidatus Thermoplasmatota archaeon]
MWEYVIGGATIFGAFVAAAALVNGRFTRKHIDRLIEKMDDHLKKMDEHLTKHDKYFATLIEQHNELLKAIASK